MQRMREVKKWSNTNVIRLTKSDLSDLGLKQGDEVDVNKLLQADQSQRSLQDLQEIDRIQQVYDFVDSKIKDSQNNLRGLDDSRDRVNIENQKAKITALEQVKEKLNEIKSSGENRK